MNFELTVEQLRKKCDPELFNPGSTDELSPQDRIIGQERAVQALKFGLGIEEESFNIYVAGRAGTGKKTAVQNYLHQIAREKTPAKDWCYVNNFSDSYQPDVLSLPLKKGVELSKDMKTLIHAIRKELPRAFETEEYLQKKENTLQSFNQLRKELYNTINQKALEDGFMIQMSPSGFLLIPVSEGRPLTEQELQSLNPSQMEELTQRRDKVEENLKTILRELKNLEKKAAEAVFELDKEIALFSVGYLVQDLIAKYKEQEEVKTYLLRVQEDILENLEIFRKEQGAEPENPLLNPAWAREIFFRRYEVNAIVSNGINEGAPVIVELNPTHNNLFGRIEKDSQFGTLVTDFTKIRSGSIHRANGGYLVLPVEELLKNPFSWETLKRCLRNKQITIEEAGERWGLIATQTLRPKPIPLSIKVILIGELSYYHLLYTYDSDFKELFKVKAEFDIVMERTPENVQKYATFVSSLCCKEKLCHLDKTALAAVVEHSSRLAENQNKLSTMFAELADIIREASFYAQEEKKELVSKEHIKKAVEQKRFRSDLYQEKIMELMKKNVFLIETAGEKVGQINGLSVASLGDLAYGRPSRITVTAGLGREGIVDIEREVKLGGPLHSKGVMILSGFLLEQFAQDRPLSLSIRIVFEQSYGGVDGDSASSTELYAILSSLSELPLRQGVAVTGSVNQKGEIQAIGGVNEKIEGYYDVCKLKGFQKNQGVMIPSANLENLMLKEEILQAVENGDFQIYSVSHINEGIELLTGVAAGIKDEAGKYPVDSVYGRITKKLEEMSRKEKDAGKKKKKTE